jgi:hypothetical protein
VLKNKALMRKFGPKREEVTGDSRFLLLFKNYSHNQVKEDEMVGACSAYLEEENAHSVSEGKRDGRRTLVRLRHRWDHNIKITFKKNSMTGYGVV